MKEKKVTKAAEMSWSEARLAPCQRVAGPPDGLLVNGKHLIIETVLKKKTQRDYSNYRGVAE